jgi:hypothetical protein
MRPALALLTGICGLVAALILAPAGVAGQPVTVPLNPAPPSFETCKATGTQTLCQGARTLPPYGPDDTGIACGSGSSAFDPFDSGVESQVAIRYYDADGNLTRRVIHETYDSAFSNPLTGMSIPYHQKNNITDVLAVPGDFNSATETVTGEVNFTVPGMGLVFQNAGRTVFDATSGDTVSSSGKQDFNEYFSGNTSVADELCTALGA